eukprot:COSAG01_NODE_822_length_13306_cov_4.866132_2_plen_156_part_00
MAIATVRSTADDWPITHTFPQEKAMLYGVCFNNAGTHIAYAISYGSGSVKLLNLVGKDEQHFENVNGGGSLAFSPDDKFLLCGGTKSINNNEHFTLLNLESGEEWTPNLPFIAMEGYHPAKSNLANTGSLVGTVSNGSLCPHTHHVNSCLILSPH